MNRNKSLQRHRCGQYLLGTALRLFSTCASPKVPNWNKLLDWVWMLVFGLLGCPKLGKKGGGVGGERSVEKKGVVGTSLLPRGHKVV